MESGDERMESEMDRHGAERMPSENRLIPLLSREEYPCQWSWPEVVAHWPAVQGQEWCLRYVRRFIYWQWDRNYRRFSEHDRQKCLLGMRKVNAPLSEILLYAGPIRSWLLDNARRNRLDELDRLGFECLDHRDEQWMTPRLFHRAVRDAIARAHGEQMWSPKQFLYDVIANPTNWIIPPRTYASLMEEIVDPFKVVGVIRIWSRCVWGIRLRYFRDGEFRKILERMWNECARRYWGEHDYEGQVQPLNRSERTLRTYYKGLQRPTRWRQERVITIIQQALTYTKHDPASEQCNRFLRNVLAAKGISLSKRTLRHYKALAMKRMPDTSNRFSSEK